MNMEFDDDLDAKKEQAAPKKAGPFARFKSYLDERKKIKEEKFLTLPIESATLTKEIDRENRKMGEYLKGIESQLSSLDEQNRTLILHAAAMSENNQTLLEQIDTLKKNNEVLLEQFKLTVKKNRISRMLNVVYTALAIIFVVYRMVIMIVTGSGM